MTRFTRYFALAALLASPLAAKAQLKAEDAIRARQSLMRLTALNFGPIGKMGSGDVPLKKEVVQTNAARIEAIWEMNPGQFFMPGSDKPVAGSKYASFTDAKPEIWSEPDKFKAASEQAVQAIKKLKLVSASGDEAAMKAAAGELGKSCKNCHDQFRSK